MRHMKDPNVSATSLHELFVYDPSARLLVRRKLLHLGMFDTAAEAHAAYLLAKQNALQREV